MVIDNCMIACNVHIPDEAAMNMSNGDSHYCITLHDHIKLHQDGEEVAKLYSAWDDMNSLLPCDTWRHRSVATMAHVMSHCLTTPSHHWNQCCNGLTTCLMYISPFQFLFPQFNKLIELCHWRLTLKNLSKVYDSMSALYVKFPQCLPENDWIKIMIVPENLIWHVAALQTFCWSLMCLACPVIGYISWLLLQPHLLVVVIK